MVVRPSKLRHDQSNEATAPLPPPGIPAQYVQRTLFQIVEIRVFRGIDVYYSLYPAKTVFIGGVWVLTSAWNGRLPHGLQKTVGGSRLYLMDDNNLSLRPRTEKSSTTDPVLEIWQIQPSILERRFYDGAGAPRIHLLPPPLTRFKS